MAICEVVLAKSIPFSNTRESYAIAEPFRLVFPVESTSDKTLTQKTRIKNENKNHLYHLDWADAATLKALVTRSTDLYRELYAESVTKHPRRFVLAGAVNHGEFLKESTGSRRFMIIPVTVAQINTVLLTQERDGILANAIQAYLDGQTWYLTQEKQQLQEQLNQGFELSDPWYALIERLQFRPRRGDRPFWDKFS